MIKRIFSPRMAIDISSSCPHGCEMMTFLVWTQWLDPHGPGRVESGRASKASSVGDVFLISQSMFGTFCIPNLTLQQHGCGLLGFSLKNARRVEPIRKADHHIVCLNLIEKKNECIFTQKNDDCLFKKSFARFSRIVLPAPALREGPHGTALAVTETRDPRSQVLGWLQHGQRAKSKKRKAGFGKSKFSAS